MINVGIYQLWKSLPPFEKMVGFLLDDDTFLRNKNGETSKPTTCRLKKWWPLGGLQG